MGGIQLYCEFFFFCAFLCVIRCVFCTAALSFHVRHLSAPTPHKRETAKRAACTAKRTSPPHAKMFLQNREGEKKRKWYRRFDHDPLFRPKPPSFSSSAVGRPGSAAQEGTGALEGRTGRGGGGGNRAKAEEWLRGAIRRLLPFPRFPCICHFFLFFFFLGVTKKNERAEINRKQTSKQANQKAGGPRACGW